MRRGRVIAYAAARIIALLAALAAAPAMAEGWVTGSLGSAADRDACVAKVERVFGQVKDSFSASEIIVFGDSVALYDIGDPFTDAVVRCWPTDNSYDAILVVHDSDDGADRDAVFDAAQEAWTADAAD